MGRIAPGFRLRLNTGLRTVRNVVRMKNGAAGAPFSMPRRIAVQAENDEPQPQVVVAFGFLITNCAPSRSSL